MFHLHGSNEFEDERDLKEAVRLKSSYEGVIRKSRFFCLLKKYMDKNIFVRMVEKDEAIPEETYQRWFVDGKRAEWRRTLAENTAAIVRVANEKKLPIILMNRVVRADSLPGYADDETRDFNAINADIAGANVLVVDTPALFEKHFGLNADKARIFLDPVHWKPMAHQLIARDLVQLMTEKAFIPADPELTAVIPR